MNIQYKTGDMFSEPVDAIVNTVNCVGVMGKGIALQFKNKYKENFKLYKKACDNKELDVGQMLLYRQPSDLLNKNKYIINFPTKKHWRSKSKLEYIENGLDALVKLLSETPEITSIAIPALGCGNGELDWKTVKDLISKRLGNVEGVQVIVFEPFKEVKEPEHVGDDLKLSLNMAFILKALSDLEIYFGGSITHLSAQKIVYFFQELYKHPFDVNFSPNMYGPYSEELKEKFIKSNKLKYINGFTGEDKTINVSGNIYAQADQYLQNEGILLESDDKIKELALLIEGFESPLGMELLSTVHWCSQSSDSSKIDDVKECINQWSDRKREMFSDKMIQDAICRLTDDGCLKA